MKNHIKNQKPQITSRNPVKMRRNKEPQLWWLLSALIPIESTMPRTCAHLATENSEEIKMLGNVSITIVFCTLWVCAKLATCRTTTKEEPRSRERPSKSKPKLINKRPKVIKKPFLADFLVSQSLPSLYKRSTKT